ncbi:MAG: beta-propeller domain-containing protein [Ruminococcus sp.]|nr:beta-propeller domain-containing protein [Ruminococcus sp.]
MEEKNKEIQQPESENAKKGISGKKKAAAIAGFSLVGLAALVLIATLLVTFFGSGSTVTEAKVTQFKNEKQIAAKLKSVIKTSNKLYKSDANYIKDIIDNSAPQDEESDSASEIEQALNNHSAYTQTNSESEADTVKLDGKYIYYLSSEGGNKISVFTAEGEDSKFVCEIGIDNNESESFSFKEFFVDNKKLVAIEEELVKISADNAKTFTRAETFDVSNIKKIKKINKFTQSGKYCSSRMDGSTLYLTTVHHALDWNDLPLAAYGDKALSDSDAVSAENIYHVENPNEPNFLVVSRVDTEHSSDTAISKAVLGSSDGVYFTNDFLYITSYEYDKDIFEKQNAEGESYVHLPVSTSQVVKVDLKNNLEMSSSARIGGYIDSQYSFDAKDDILRVTTAKTLDNDKFTESANCFTLDKNLKCVGKLTDFAHNESIKAVRYIDDTAYVISYKAADPLFIIDLKNNSEPRILSETKISAFSPTLVAADKNTLLSVGYYTAKENAEDSDGVKIVTFDVSNKTNPKKIDEKVYKGYESPAQQNSNALLINEEKGEYTIPMTAENQTKGKNKALRFRLEKGKINVANDYSSEIFRNSDESLSTLDRCLSSGDYIYLLGSDYNYYKDISTALIDAVEYQ